MLVLSQKDVAELLPMKDCIQIMKTALVDLARGDAAQELRSAIHIEAHNFLGLMPVVLRPEKVAGVKLISIFPDNRNSDLPSHQGCVLLFDSSNGVLKAFFDGEKITAIRTAAVSAVATDLLARKDTSILGIIGTGEQARTHLEAMLLVRPFKRILVWGPTREKAVAFTEETARKFDVEVEVAASAKEAVQEADVICTVSSSRNPIVHGQWVKPGTHVNAVGASRPTDRELDSALVAKSKFYVDRMESAIHESGDYLIPLHEGLITQSHIVGEVGDLLLAKVGSRKSEEDITIFKSLGLAVEDVAAANYIYQEAQRLHRGTFVPL